MKPSEVRLSVKLARTRTSRKSKKANSKHQIQINQTWNCWSGDLFAILDIESGILKSCQKNDKTWVDRDQENRCSEEIGRFARNAGPAHTNLWEKTDLVPPPGSGFCRPPLHRLIEKRFLGLIILLKRDKRYIFIKLFDIRFMGAARNWMKIQIRDVVFDQFLFYIPDKLPRWVYKLR